MRITPTPSGGRVVEGVTRWGNFRVEWDADGNLISESITMREPHNAEISTPGQLALIDARKAICATCEHNQGLTLRTVKCRNCGCSGVSLLHGMCKLGKWNP